MPFAVNGAVLIERRLTPYNVKRLSHLLHLDDQVIKIEQSMKHHAVLDAVRPLTLDATGNSNDAIRNTADACDTTDIDFGGVTVIDGAGNDLNHWVSLADSPPRKAPHSHSGQPVANVSEPPQRDRFIANF